MGYIVKDQVIDQIAETLKLSGRGVPVIGNPATLKPKSRYFKNINPP